MEDMFAMISAEVIKLLGIVVTGLLAWATTSVTRYFKSKGIVKKIEAHKNLADIVVNAIEQGYKELNGAEKFDKAKEQLLEVADKKGIKISEKESDVFIENAVKEMKKAYRDELARDELVQK